MRAIMRGAFLLMLVATWGLWSASSANAADSLQVEPMLLHGALLPGQVQTTYLMLKLLPAEIEEEQRSPINVSIVLDRSGSMSGEKLTKAKAAACMALEQLREFDLVSVVTYDDTISVPQPASPLGDARSIQARIQAIQTGGMTALFAGVSRGAAELRKHHDRRKVNRIVLLSDGLANVGPSSPEQLAELGDSLAKEGIAVTTIGLGLDYNEDLLTRLAVSSQGNHSFVAEVEELHAAFKREFGAGLSVAARDLHLVLRLAPWVKPVRVLNAAADILGDRVEMDISQLYSGKNSYVLLELEVAPPDDSEEALALLQLKYNEMPSGAQGEIEEAIAHETAVDQAGVQASLKREVRIAVAQQLAMDRWLQAVKLRDQGRIDEAGRLLSESEAFLAREAAATGSELLESMRASAMQEASDIKNRGTWKLQRKRMQTIQVIRIPSSGY